VTNNKSEHGARRTAFKWLVTGKEGRERKLVRRRCRKLSQSHRGRIIAVHAMPQKKGEGNNRFYTPLLFPQTNTYVA
jgi:hypothetical protein